MTLLYEEITKKILEACFEVINELGAGIEVGLLVNFGRSKIEFHRLRKPTPEQSQ